MSGLEVLSLTCNICQLISFTREVISLAKSAHESGSLDPTLKDYAAHAEKFSRKIPSPPAGCTASEKELYDLAQNCQTISIKLRL